jgi:siroheme synthase (precorrin-2 oxidase/ferrochelatase)
MLEKEGIEAFITEIKLRDALLKKALSEDPQLIVTEDELNTRKVNNMEYISKKSVVALIKMYSNNANDEQKFILADILSDINEFSVKEIEDGLATKQMNEKRFKEGDFSDEELAMLKAIFVVADTTVQAKVTKAFEQCQKINPNGELIIETPINTVHCKFGDADVYTNDTGIICVNVEYGKITRGIGMEEYD